MKIGNNTSKVIILTSFLFFIFCCTFFRVSKVYGIPKITPCTALKETVTQDYSNILFKKNTLSKEKIPNLLKNVSALLKSKCNLSELEIDTFKTWKKTLINAKKASEEPSQIVEATKKVVGSVTFLTILAFLKKLYKLSKNGDGKPDDSDLTPEEKMKHKLSPQLPPRLTGPSSDSSSSSSSSSQSLHEGEIIKPNTNFLESLRLAKEREEKSPVYSPGGPCVLTSPPVVVTPDVTKKEPTRPPYRTFSDKFDSRHYNDLIFIINNLFSLLEKLKIRGEMKRGFLQRHNIFSHYLHLFRLLNLVVQRSSYNTESKKKAMSIIKEDWDNNLSKFLSYLLKEVQFINTENCRRLLEEAGSNVGSSNIKLFANNFLESYLNAIENTLKEGFYEETHSSSIDSYWE